MLSACYEILRSSVEELMRVGIIFPWQPLLSHQSIQLLAKDRESINCVSVQLLEVAFLCQGLSGRALRKLPFLGKILRRKMIRAVSPGLPSGQHTLFTSKRSALQQMILLAH